MSSVSPSGYSGNELAAVVHPHPSAELQSLLLVFSLCYLRPPFPQRPHLPPPIYSATWGILVWKINCAHVGKSFFLYAFYAYLHSMKVCFLRVDIKRPCIIFPLLRKEMSLQWVEGRVGDNILYCCHRKK